MSAAAAILDFLNCDILLAIWVEKVETHQPPNFVKIGQSVVKVLRFFVFFQDGGRHDLGLSNSRNFNS